MYGWHILYTLKKIILQISKSSEDINISTEHNNTKQIVENVNEVKIELVAAQNNETSNSENSSDSSELNSQNKKENISSQVKKELKEYLSGVYEISTKNIFINE